MTERLLIVGAGAQARYVIETARRNHRCDIIGLIDTFENRDYWGRQIDGVEVLGGAAVLESNYTGYRPRRRSGGGRCAEEAALGGSACRPRPSLHVDHSSHRDLGIRC